VVATPSEVEGGTLTALRESVKLLGEKAPDELEAYRGFVLDVANRVAAAKGGVKENETAAIEKITAALAS
jgi:tellurite resistance protein